MITTKDIEQKIYERYIRPTEKKRPDYIGVEFELPMLNREKKPVDFQVVHSLADTFAEKFQFTNLKYDDEGQITSAGDPATGDDLSFDCSYNTLELSFGREQNLNVLESRFRKYYSFIRKFLQDRGHSITGMGINPHYQYNKITPIPNGRYRMLLHHLESYTRYQDRMNFHDLPYYGLITCSSQTHLNGKADCLPLMINVFNQLEPFKALLFSNSILGDDLCCRDMLWRDSMHGLNPRNVDCWEVPVSSLEEIIAYIRSMSLYCTERDGKYINFPPTTLSEYFSKERIRGEYFDGKQYQEIFWKPELSDLQYLRSFKFVDLTFRGTIELRSSCMQPVKEAFTVPAFHLGLAQDLPSLQQTLESASVYQKGYSPAELRKLFVKKELPSFADKDELRSTLRRLLQLSADGLQKRGLGEERFLTPLWKRADLLLSPAREILQGLESGKTPEYYIDRFGTLEGNDEITK